MLWSLFLGLFRSRASLEAENLALRQQIIVLQRTAPKRLCFNTIDRVIFVGLYRLFLQDLSPWPSHLFGFTFTSTTHAACTNKTRR